MLGPISRSYVNRAKISRRAEGQASQKPWFLTQSRGTGESRPVDSESEAFGGKTVGFCNSLVKGGVRGPHLSAAPLTEP